MDNLVNYGSDDDNVDSDNSSKYRQGTLGSNRLAALHGGGGDYGRVPSQQRSGGSGGGTNRTADDGTNYDQIQMDLSEEDEPAKNSVSQKSQMSPEMNRDRTNRPQHRDNDSHGGNNRQRDGRDNKESNSRNVDRDRDREQRDKNHRDDYERDNRSNVKDSSRDDRDRSSYRGARDQQQRNERRNSRDSKDTGAKKGDRDSRDSTRRDNRENNRDSRDGVDNRRDRDRDNSNRRDRDNFNSRDRGDRDNYNNRDNRQRDNRRRSPTNHQNSNNNYRGGAAGRRFDRASNKMAQLEKLGIEIKAPENFVPPASGIYTPDDARGNNGPCHFENADGGGGGDVQFFMPGVTGRFRDQIERRKQLWAKSKQPDTPNPTVAPTQRPIPPTPTIASGITERSTWAATTFAQDTDGRQANKFKRLMGIRGAADGAGQTVEGSTNKRQEEMFSSMEAQYEVARTATHTMRGVGLGFSSSVQGLYQK